MRVLLVDDSNQIAEAVRLELEGDSEFEVTYVLDPLAARRQLNGSHFDVVVVDILYEHLMRPYANRLRERRVSLRSDRSFLISGLATLYDASLLAKPPGAVVWVVGMENRELHMLLAHQELHVRAYSSKGPTPNGISDLKDAIRAAASKQSYNDPLLDPYLPRDETPLVKDALFGREIWRGIWRTLALGVRRHEDIAAEIGYQAKSVRNVMSEMAHQLSQLDPGVDPEHDPSTVLATYAASNWQFFLDDTVMRLFPPRVAVGLRQRTE